MGRLLTEITTYLYGQSLNQYSYVQGNPVSYTDPFGLSPVNGLFSDTNFAHSLLGLLSCIPGFVGSTASAIDGLVYAVVDKDYSMTALCFMDALSFGIGKAGSKLLKAKKYTNTAETLINASHLMSNAASFGMCADAMMATGFSMYDKYYIQGQSADSNTKWEVLSLGMSALGCVISGRGISKGTKSMSNMLQQEGFTNALKGEVMEMASVFKSKMPELNNKGFVNLDELGKIGKGGKGGSNTAKLRDTKNIRYSQDNIRGTFDDGTNVNELVYHLKNSPEYASTIEPIRLVKYNDLPSEVQQYLGKQGVSSSAVFTLDNRRLYAAKQAGVKVNSVWATQADLEGIDLIRRFTTETAGKTIEIR